MTIPSEILPVLCMGTAVGLVILTEFLGERFGSHIEEAEE